MAFSPPAGGAIADLIAEELRVEERRGRHMAVEFQEIKDLTSGAVVGHEVLTRPSCNVTPLRWYEQGRRLGLMAELEARPIALALEVLPPGTTMLTVNFSLDVLDAPKVRSILHELSALDRPVVVELSEHNHTAGERLNETLEFSRSLGLRIAVDDAGTGDSGPQFVYEVRPDVIKIDHTHTWALNYSAVQRSFVREYLSIATELAAENQGGCDVIIEGVSSQLVAEAVRGLGQEHNMNLLAQGYWVTRTTKLEAVPSVILD